MEVRPHLLSYVLLRETLPAAFGVLALVLGAASPFMGAPAEFSVGAAVLGFAVLAIVLGYSSLHCRTTRLYLSNEEIVLEYGILNRTSRSVPLHMFTEAALSRTFVETLAGVGTLKIYGRMDSNSQLEVADVQIDRLKAMQNQILSLVRELPPSLPDQYSVAGPNAKPPAKPAAPAKK